MDEHEDDFMTTIFYFHHPSERGLFKYIEGGNLYLREIKILSAILTVSAGIAEKGRVDLLRVDFN